MFLITLSPFAMFCLVVAIIIDKCRGERMSFEEILLTAFGVGMFLCLVFCGIVAILCKSA